MKVVVFLVAFFACHIINAQDYQVLSVKGNVKFKGGKKLEAKDKLKTDDQLIFSTSSDAVAVVGAKTGRFVITPSPKSKDGEFVALVKGALTPGTKKLSTRSGAFNNALDFSRYFKDTILILPTLSYGVSKTTFKQDDKSFFFIRYNFSGEEINKKIKPTQDSLVVNRLELFSIDGKPVDPKNVSNVRLMYLSGSQSTLLSNLNIIAPDTDQLRGEASTLKDLFKGRSGTEIRNEVFAYFNEFYGKVDEANFSRWYLKQPEK